MFKFASLTYETAKNGQRNWTYTSTDYACDVLAPGYFEDVGELFEAGDYITINVADGTATMPVITPEKREAPSALLH